MTTIHAAVGTYDVEALRRELSRGVDPNLRAPEFDDKTPLQLLPRVCALSTEAWQCYKLLIEHGASVDVRDSINDTLLHDACLYNNAELVEFLLEAGADVHTDAAARAAACRRSGTSRPRSSGESSPTPSTRDTTKSSLRILIF